MARGRYYTLDSLLLGRSDHSQRILHQTPVGSAVSPGCMAEMASRHERAAFTARAESATGDGIMMPAKAP